jgi:hypothetical protein
VPISSYSRSKWGELSPSATTAATPIDTASAPSASALATSAPDRIPPETISCTCLCMPSSWSDRTASGIAAMIGIPTCSMNTSWLAAVPPSMPSSTITSAPALTASATSK